MDNKLKERVQSKSKGPIFLFSSYGSVQSRYLREPLGSCHDMCKHGLKHKSVDDKKHLTFRRFVANSIASDAMQSHVKGPDIGIAKRKSRIKTKPPEKAIFLHDIIQQDKQEVGLFEKSVNSNVATSSSINEGAVNFAQIILQNDQEQNARSLSKDNENSSIIFEDSSPAFTSIELLEEANFPIRTKQKLQEQLDDDEKAKLLSDENNNIDPVTPSFQNKSCEIFPGHIIYESPAKESNGVVVLNYIKKVKKQVNKQEVTSMPKPSHVKRNILKQKKSSSILLPSRADVNIPMRKLNSNSEEPIKSATIRVIKHRKAFLKKESASPEIQRSSQTASIPSRKMANYAKPVISLRSRTPLVRSMSHISASRNLNGWRKLEQNANKNNEMPNVGKVMSKPPKDSVSSTTPSWSAISLKSRKSTYAKHATGRRVGKSTEILGGIHEKVLEIIKEKPSKCQGTQEEKSFTSIGNGHASQSTASEGSELTENEKVCSKPRRVTVKEEDKRQGKRTPAFQSNDNSSSPYKLRFRRGKVIEVRTSDVVGPKRLRFRRGRVLGENTSNEVAQRSFRRRKEMIDSNYSSSGAHVVTLKQTNSEAKVVMLKHQDAQEKKDMQALLNHVIEETASKLVETRKSKVKALVGAFETVISLQETKQTAAV